MYILYGALWVAVSFGVPIAADSLNRRLDNGPAVALGIMAGALLISLYGLVLGTRYLTGVLARQGPRGNPWIWTAQLWRSLMGADDPSAEES